MSIEIKNLEENEKNVMCPNCGALMTLRTARKGRFAGRKFYGCPNWKTSCKGVIINIGEDEENLDKSFFGSDKAILPVSLKARERFENYDALFFQNMAIPQELLDVVNKGDLTRNDLNLYGQWRLDFPLAAKFKISEDVERVIFVARKILTRGRVTVLSPQLEEKIRKSFLSSNFDVSSIDLNAYLTTAVVEKKTSTWFDGKKRTKLNGRTFEHYFYEEILSKHLGPYYKRFVLPQVSFSSLSDVTNSDEATGYQRLDFLITTPKKSIAVELDDLSHDDHLSRDSSRDELLREDGMNPIRIKNSEIESGLGSGLQELVDMLSDEKIKIIKKITPDSRYLLAVKLAHQIQMSVLEGIIKGIIPFTNDKIEINFDLNSVFFKKSELELIIKPALNDLKDLIQNLYSLYGVKFIFLGFELNILNKLSSIDGPVITFNENLITKGPRLIIQDIFFPNIISHDGKTTTPALDLNIQENNLLFFLSYIFRYDSFLEGQFEAIERTLQGKDAVVLLPTGAGKSLVFQLASLILPGVTIIIDPITALIDDQRDNLSRKGIDRAIGITSQNEGPIRSKLIEAFSRGEYIFCYIAPERLQSDEFRNSLTELTLNIPISLIAIDEAHCVSEWGHDFRTAYLNIGRTTREYCKSHGRVPSLLALTGTASNAVLRDVQRELQVKDFEAIITPLSFDRKELNFNVTECGSDQKQNILRSILQQYIPNLFNTTENRFYSLRDGKTNCGIIFCPHAGGSYGVIEVAQSISSLGISTKYYSGKTPKFYSDKEWVKLKKQNANDFKNNKFSIFVATKSFGMGIDKPNIRFIVHLGLPSSIESLYQEVGRAGRDKEMAHSILILSNDFKERTAKLLNPKASIDELNEIMDKERDWSTDDDITRALWFHLNSFRGVEKELNDIDYVMSQIGDMESTRKINVVFQSGSRNSLEKAVHRLLLLGVIDDYTIDYTANEFRLVITGATKEKIIEKFCFYIEGYNRGRVAQEKEKLLVHLSLSFSEFVRMSAEILINFIYDTIEKGRRRAFREIISMYEDAASKTEDQDSLIRERILLYLETNHSQKIQQVLDELDSFNSLKLIFDGGIIPDSGELVGGVRSQRDASEIRGEVSRYLESYPDYPGLLLLRALSEIYCQNSDTELAFQNIEAACNFAFQRYQIPKLLLYDVLIWMLEKIYYKNNDIYESYTLRLLELLKDDDFLKTIMSCPNMDEAMLYVPMLYSLNKQSKKIINILKS